MEYYQLIKQIHVATAVISVLGFCVRVWWMYCESNKLNHKISKILPHLNDTLLLVSAITLSNMSGLSPLHEAWLGAKIVFLIGYIVAGSYAIKKGKTLKSRLFAFAIAMICISLIFVSALTKLAFLI